MEGERREFLPPQPAGPEPELGRAPAPQPAQPQAPQPAWQQPPPLGWGYAQRPQPDNGPAVAGFVLSLVGGGLLFLSAGLSSLISLACSIFGMVYSRKGKRKVQSGETTRNAGLAQAGWVIGIVAVVLSALATAAWTAVLIAALADEDFRDDLEREFDNSDTVTALVRTAAIGARALLA
jgi:hypothetical protein